MLILNLNEIDPVLKRSLPQGLRGALLRSFDMARDKAWLLAFSPLIDIEVCHSWLYFIRLLRHYYIDCSSLNLCMLLILSFWILAS